MFKKMIDDWRQANEVMDKVLKELCDPSKWIYDNDITYKHVDSDLIIKWGYDNSYGGGSNSHWIEKPVYISIPFRHRKRFKECIHKIKNRGDSNTNMSFLNQYLDGEYIIKGIKVIENKSIAFWLEEQGIYDWYMYDNTIWFKNEEDIMAYKLRWE